MAQIIITKETKAKLLSAAAYGQPISPLLFILTRGDRAFQAELVRAAEHARNGSFFQSLKDFLTEQEREYLRLDAALRRPIAAQARKRNRFKKRLRLPALDSKRRIVVGRWKPKGTRKRIPPPARPPGQQPSLGDQVPPSPVPPKQPGCPSPPPPPKRSPSGIGFKEYLERRGLYYEPKYRSIFVRFVSGGAFESNRRRH
jgi:hypothetical protein